MSFPRKDKSRDFLSVAIADMLTSSILTPYMFIEFNTNGYIFLCLYLSHVSSRKWFKKCVSTMYVYMCAMLINTTLTTYSESSTHMFLPAIYMSFV